MSDLEKTVHEAVLELVQRKSPEVTAVSNDQSLTDDLGLESMDYAELVAVLEMEFEVDPFAEKVSITSVRTVGNLCDAYASVMPS